MENDPKRPSWPADDILVASLARFRDRSPGSGRFVVTQRPASEEVTKLVGGVLAGSHFDAAGLMPLTADSVASAVEIWDSPDEKWFAGAVGGALDDPHLRDFGRLQLEDAVKVLFQTGAPTALVRTDVAHALGPVAAGQLHHCRIHAALIIDGVDQVAARILQAGDLLSGEPDDPDSPYDWIFQKSIPNDLAGVLLSRAEIGILTALVAAAVQVGFTPASAMALAWAGRWRACLTDVLGAILGLPFVHLPLAAGLGVRPMDLAAVVAKHELTQRNWEAFERDAEASGLEIYPPLASDE